MSNRDEHGMALVLVMMTITLLAALAAVITLATITETAIAANYREAAEALHAAEGSVEFVMQELAGLPDWDDVIAGLQRSAFLGAEPPPGPDRPGTPGVLYASGRFRDLVGPRPESSGVYVEVWIADRSEVPEAGPEASATVAIRGEGFGTRGSRRSVEVVVTKVDNSAVRVLSWREIR